MNSRRGFLKKSGLGIIWLGLDYHIEFDAKSEQVNEKYRQEQAPQELYKISANKEWQSVDTADLVVKEGTALDFSRFNEPGPAGKYGRAIKRPDGQLAFAERPDQPVRFFCTNLANSLPALEDIEPYAHACRQQGYNAVRLHWLDTTMVGTEDADGKRLNPEGLDRYERVWAALKKNGIYVLPDIVSYSGFDRLYENRGLLYLLYSEKEARDLWSRIAKDLLTHLNPYTNTTLADDPCVLITDAYNEQNIRIPSGKGKRLPQGLTGAWQNYLRNKYPAVGAWRYAWGDPDPAPGAMEFTDVPIFINDELYETGNRGNDTRHFLYECEDEMYTFFEKVIRELGYQGLFYAHDYISRMELYPIRSRMDAVGQHGYFFHPTRYIDSGSIVEQKSSLAEGLGTLRYTLGCRIAGLPLIFTEYNHCYWNDHRYEEGLAYGAYCSFQNVSLASITHNVVRLSGGVLHPFCGGDDPVQRASQVVSGLLYHERRILPAPHRVNIYVSRNEALTFGTKALSSDQSHITLLTGFEVMVENGPKTPPADIIFRLKGSSEIINDVPGVPAKADEATGTLPGIIDELRKKKILPAGNSTYSSKGIFECETGQIRLDSGRKCLQVKGKNINGACMEKLDSPLEVENLVIESANVSSSVTIASIDDTEIPESKRLLLVIATDARNSNETYDGSNHAVLNRLGTLPVLMRTGIFNITIKRSPRSRELKAWSLALDGTRSEELPVKSGRGWVKLEIDTSALPKGPTPFFELASV